MKTEISAFSFHNSSFLISSLLLAILYLLGTASFAAANTFDDALAVYERGDYVQAMKLFRQLAETGHQWAQRRVGLMYAEGKGVPQDYREAMKWYRSAAAHGNESAQVNLGMMYTKGRGVGQDLVRAHMWFNLAAAASTGNSRDTATENRERIAAKMTAEQIGSAQEMARRCQESKLKNCD
jgi:TPR repeat protein